MIYKQRQASSDALPFKFESECKWIYLRIRAKVLLILNGLYQRWWKDMKWRVVIVLTVLVIIGIIVGKYMKNPGIVDR
jgi:hypothetical protein